MTHDPDYQRSEGHGGVIGDLMTDGREAIQFFKDNRDRIERLLDFADRAVQAIDGTWIAKLLGIKGPKA